MKKELCVNLVIYQDYTEMHVQQNVKFEINIYTKPINFLIYNLETCTLKVLFTSTASSKLHKKLLLP